MTVVPPLQQHPNPNPEAAVEAVEGQDLEEEEAVEAHLLVDYSRVECPLSRNPEEELHQRQQQRLRPQPEYQPREHPLQRHPLLREKWPLPLPRDLRRFLLLRNPPPPQPQRQRARLPLQLPPDPNARPFMRSRPNKTETWVSVSATSSTLGKRTTTVGGKAN